MPTINAKLNNFIVPFINIRHDLFLWFWLKFSCYLILNDGSTSVIQIRNLTFRQCSISAYKFLFAPPFACFCPKLLQQHFLYHILWIGQSLFMSIFFIFIHTHKFFYFYFTKSVQSDRYLKTMHKLFEKGIDMSPILSI